MQDTALPFAPRRGRAVEQERPHRQDVTCYCDTRQIALHWHLQNLSGRQNATTMTTGDNAKRTSIEAGYIEMNAKGDQLRQRFCVSLSICDPVVDAVPHRATVGNGDDSVLVTRDSPVGASVLVKIRRIDRERSTAEETRGEGGHSASIEQRLQNGGLPKQATRREGATFAMPDGRRMQLRRGGRQQFIAPLLAHGVVHEREARVF